MKAFPRWGDGILGDASPAQVISLREDHALISKVDLFWRDVVLGDDVVKLLGVGGVWTISNRRKRGCATMLLKYAEEIAKEKATGLILFTLDGTLGFYEDRGYVRHKGLVTMQQPWAKETERLTNKVMVPSHVNVMHNLLMHSVSLHEPIEIRGLPW